MTLAQRIEKAIAEKFGGSIRAFQQALQERGVRGSTYASVHSYVRGDATPGLEFVETAADVLGVRPEWLAFERGRPTQAEQDAADVVDAVDRSSRNPLLDLAFSGLSEEEAARHKWKQRAMRRFIAKIGDGPTGVGPWTDRDNLTRVLQEALRFLIHVEEFFQREDLPPEMFLRHSQSNGWNATWEDAVLDLYSRRVRGLGERTDSPWDGHVWTHDHSPIVIRFTDPEESGES